MSISEHIKGILDTLPERPGCYLMKDASAKVIYVGKAVNLRSRVRSYFHASAKQDNKTSRLIRSIADIEWVLVDSELEALILEMNLIKKHRPRFNVRLKDDKRYPYIKVHWQEPFPKVTVTRRMIKDGSRYYGPYTSAWAVHQTLDVLRHIFPYLTCDREITGKDSRPCLYYDIKLCVAPCIGVVDQSGYRQMIEDLCRFLEGRSSPVLERLRSEMARASDELRYEHAAALRDQVNAIVKVVEKQKIISSEEMDSDVIAVARSDGEACVQVFFIRAGKLIGREYFILEGTEDETCKVILSQFIKQFYTEAATIPPQLLLPSEIEEAKIVRQWLKTRRGGEKVELKIPRNSGTPKELVQMATENAVETLRSLKEQWEMDRHRQSEALTEIQHALGMSEPPKRIECYDISNTQGTASVGSMVVFEQGTPNKKLYRRFNIKTVDGPDDFASMEEVLKRRFDRWQIYQQDKTPGKKIDEAFALLPDLLIVDGGKGQLGRAVSVIEQFALSEKISLAGQAKQQEEMFLPGRNQSLKLPRHSQGLYLIQRIRDEAHRFAITAHRSRRTKLGLASRLDAVPGIGPAKRKALLSKFGSIENILEASAEEIASLPGIDLELANLLKMSLE